MKVIVTGGTGMVGEGVLLECLDNPAVERVFRTFNVTKFEEARGA